MITPEEIRKMRIHHRGSETRIKNHYKYLDKLLKNGGLSQAVYDEFNQGRER